MEILCLDLEGVLIPEIWQAVAAHTGIAELGKTTRDIPVYDDLMQLRLGALAGSGVTYAAIADVIGTLDPLPGAVEFLDEARRRYQIAIISDTFYEFGQPMMAKLGYPLLLCHRLTIEKGSSPGTGCDRPTPSASRYGPFRASAIRWPRLATATTTSPCWSRRTGALFSVRQRMSPVSIRSFLRPAVTPSC